MSRAALPHLRVSPAASIVNVSSVSGTMGNAGQANYAAGKSAVVGLTKTLAKEWGQFKVNCNAVAFGYIETRLTASKDDSNVMEIDGEEVDQLAKLHPSPGVETGCGLIENQDFRIDGQRLPVGVPPVGCPDLRVVAGSDQDGLALETDRFT